MVIKGIIEEDFINYKKPSMTIEFPHCTFKCGADICQNNALVNKPDIEVDAGKLAERYVNNPITEAVVMQGLEPLDSFEDVMKFVEELRIGCGCQDDIVIYTGYTEDEVGEVIEKLRKFGNVVVKFGRYVAGQKRHYDEVLGVMLASDNQYAKRI